MRSNDEAPLEVYVDYTSLPANQAAVLLLSLENLYQLVASGPKRTTIRLPTNPDHIAHLAAPTDNKSVLTLESTNTGDSITFRFAGRKQPTSIRWQGEDVEVVLPIWSAPAVAVGALVLGGMEIYSKWLDIQYQQAQIDYIKEEIHRIGAETDEVLRRLKRDDEYRDHIARSNGRHLAAISKNIQAFHQVANQPNIKKIKINGFDLK